MAEPFKNHFNHDYVLRLADRVQATFPHLNADPLRRLTDGTLLQLEMKGRASALADSLRQLLGGSGGELFQRVVQLAESDPPWSGFDIWPHTMVVEQDTTDDVDDALDAMQSLTERFTSEFAVRPWLRRYPDTVLARMHTLTTHPSEHVRRWVSEGTRPRLPWGLQVPAFIHDPTPLLPLLEALRDDPSEYVRRSVANHLNDIAKDHPHLTLQTCERWLTNATPERRRLVHHALRTLIKKGNAHALNLVGASTTSIHDASLSLSPTTLTLGQTLALQLDATATPTAPERWVIDVAIHFVKSNGQTSPKVFKGAVVDVQKPGPFRWTKNIPLRPVTTRRHYPGATRVDLMVNGQPVASATFDFIIPD